VTADRHTTEQAPGKPLSAPENASTPEVGVSGSSTPLNGPHAGADGFDAHNAGPSIRECVDQDRRWPLQKHGE
jgi:hypothetical protein